MSIPATDFPAVQENDHAGRPCGDLNSAGDAAVSMRVRAADRPPGKEDLDEQDKGATMSIEHDLATHCKIIVDESFLLNEAGQVVLRDRLLPALEQQTEARLILPERVLQTVRDRRQAADRAGAGAFALIDLFAQRCKLDRRGEAHEVCGATAGTRDLLVRVAYQFQQRHQLAFLTLDQETAWALLAANQARSIEHAQPLRVLRLNREGNGLDDWDQRGIRDVPQPPETPTLPQMLDVLTLAANTRIFVDTSSFMSSSAQRFFQQKLIPALLYHHRPLLIAQRVILELEKHTGLSLASIPDAERPAAEAKIVRAQAGLALLEELKAAGLVDLRHEANEIAGSRVFVDALIQRVFVQHQKDVPLTLITQDRRLAQQILDNAQHLGVGAQTPQIGFINEIARPDLPVAALGNWAWRLTWSIYAPSAESSESSAASNVPRPRAAQDARPRWAPFQRATTVYAGSTAVLPVQHLPTEGHTVIGDQSGPLTLQSAISEGGEGIIYRTAHPERICKVYFQERLTKDRQAKLERMVTRPSPDPMICWPVELVRNAHGEFVGYLMPLAQGETFNLSIFKKPLLQAMFPHWDRRHLVQLAITTLRLIKKLHALNVLMGDINPNNFMVRSEKEVYVVDTDSFQIEGFPCPVGTPHFTPPELIGRSYSDFLRTPEHEAFAVATLLFMILFPGKPPYSGQGGGDVIESIQKHKFPYVTEEGENSIRPFGPYRFIWSHLHPLLKQDFRAIFYDGKRVPEGHPDRRNAHRPTSNYVDRFLFDLRVYRKAIHAGQYSAALFPADYRLREGEEDIEVPCAEPGCTRTARFAKGWYATLVQRGQTAFRCGMCFEIHRLRQQTRASRPMQPPSSHRPTTRASSTHASPASTPRSQPSSPPSTVSTTASSNWPKWLRWALILFVVAYLIF